MLKGEKLALYLLILLALALNVSAVYSPDQYTAAYWNFDECDGNTANDVTGNGNTGTLNNVEWTTDSVSGCAVKFNGVDSSIAINTHQNLISFQNQITLEAWVKRNSHSSGGIITKNGPYYLSINPENRFPDDGTIRSGVLTDSLGWVEFSSITSLQIDKWYHIAMVYDGSRLKIFINGVEDNSIAAYGKIIETGQSANIGCCQVADDFFDGIIDEVRISNISRTSFDVQTTTTVSTTTTSTIVTTIPIYSKDEVDTLLAERDARISALESRASLLETALSNVRNTLTTLQDTVSNLFTSLFGLPKGLRQEMICSSMKATNQTFAQGFGLTCTLNDKGACSCS